MTEGLKMLPEAAGRGRHFQARGHSFSPYGPTLSRQITCLFFFCTKLVFRDRVQMGLFTQLLSVNRLARWSSLAHKHNISVTSENTRDISVSIRRNMRRTNPFICLMLFSLAHKHKHKRISVSINIKAWFPLVR